MWTDARKGDQLPVFQVSFFPSTVDILVNWSNVYSNVDRARSLVLERDHCICQTGNEKAYGRTQSSSGEGKCTFEDG